MKHVTDGMLRRLIDEPLAVPDAQVAHVNACVRCQNHRERVAEDRMVAHRLVARPRPLPDTDEGWRRFQGAPVPDPARLRRHLGKPGSHSGRRVSGGVAIVVGTALVAGGAAAAALTTVYSPDHVTAGPSLDPSQLRAFAGALGLSGHEASRAKGEGGASAPPDTSPRAVNWAYGAIDESAGSTQLHTESLSAAQSASGFQVRLPTTLPAGVGGSPTFLVRGATSAVVHFSSAAGGALAGSTLDLNLGPIVTARYEGTSASGLGDVPALTVIVMGRPTATSDGATLAQLESFLLSRNGFPSDLAQQVRLLGDLQSVLPVPTLPGASEVSTTIRGAPAVLETEGGGAASAVVWEDSTGLVHTVAGVLNSGDVLGVARQLG